MFSVIIPAYNHERFIARTIESVLAQDFTNFELIIVDDGSVDATADVVAAYQDSRIRLIRQANRGEAGARNAGIAQATRTWLAFLDGDDYWFPNHLSEATRIITACPWARFMSTSFTSGSEWAAVQPLRRSDTVECASFFKLAGQDAAVIVPSSAFVRRDVVDEVGDFSLLSRRGTDLDYWARLGLVTPLAHSRAVTVYYYQHSNSIMALGHHQTASVFEDVDAMWPSVAVIRSAQNDPAYDWLKLDFEIYERQVTYISMIGHILRREYGMARRLAARLPGRRLDRAALIAEMLRLPDTALGWSLDMRHALRRKFRPKG